MRGSCSTSKVSLTAISYEQEFDEVVIILSFGHVELL